MNTNYLLPRSLRPIGWAMLIPGLILGFLTVLNDWQPNIFEWKVFALYTDEIMGETGFLKWIENNVLNEVLGIALIVGGIFVAFSREKVEDEMIQSLRLESLVWAVYANFIILLLAILLLYEIAFLWVMIFNMFTVLLFFIVRFQWKLNKLRKSTDHEE